jgi:archaellum biogenesis protein FlaJ (TadC family)
MYPPDPSTHEPNRSRRTAAVRRAPAVAVSLALAAVPVVVVGLLSYPTELVAALAGAVVATAAYGTVVRRR